MSGMYAQRRQQQQQHQRRVVNGRLTAKPILGLDPRRTLVAASVCLALWFLNHAHSMSSAYDDDWITDYGLFSVLEYGDHITFSVASLPLNCWFRGAGARRSDAEDDAPPPLDFCTALRDQLAHQKPLLWDAEDDAHSLHRMFILLLLLSTLAVLCRPPGYSVFTGNKWLDPFISIFAHNTRQPVYGFLWCAVQANFLLYPIWKTITRVAPLQDDKSWLKLFPEQYPFGNQLLTLVVVIIMAGAANAAGHYWTRQYLLRFEGLMGAALGYYRGVLGGSPPGFSLAFLSDSLTFLPQTVSVNSLTWTFLIACATQQSPMVAVAFFGANVAGAQIGQYQFRHLGINATIQQVAEGLGQLFTKFFGGM